MPPYPTPRRSQMNSCGDAIPELLPPVVVDPRIEEVERQEECQLHYVHVPVAAFEERHVYFSAVLEKRRTSLVIQEHSFNCDVWWMLGRQARREG